MASNRGTKLTRVRTLLSQKNIYLAEHPGVKMEVAQRDIAENVKQLKIDDWVKVVNGVLSSSKGHRDCLELVVDEAAKKEAAELDGCYVIKTDLTVEVASAKTVHDRYKDLAQVERAFRTFKNGHMEVQPTFVRTEASTRGHVFVVMLAYLVEQELDKYWRGLDVTVAEGIDPDWSGLRGAELTIGQATCQQVPEPTGLSKRLLDAADIKLPAVLPLRKSRCIGTGKSSSRNAARFNLKELAYLEE